MREQGHILILSGVRGDTRRYRVLHLGEQLRLVGLEPIVTHLSDPRLFALAQTARIAVLHRIALDATVERLLAQLQRQQTLIVLDADDFLYDPGIMRWIDSPDFQDPVRAAIYRRELLRHRATLDRCDAILVSTEFLGQMMAPFGKPVVVHRNAFNLTMLAQSRIAVQNHRPPAERVVIGYASGTHTHDQDLAMIRPALRVILERYPQVELKLLGAIGAVQDWGAFQHRVHTAPLVPWRDLPAQLAGLDINLAPLRPHSPFNQAKSAIKYMEAALVGTPTVATPTDAFSRVIQSGQNGMLAETAADWQEYLAELVEDSLRRQSMGALAQQEVLAQDSPWVRGRQAVEHLASLSRMAGKGLPDLAPDPVSGDAQNDAIFMASQFMASAEHRPTHFDLALYTLRNRGLPVLAGQVWVFFRRMVAPIFPFRQVELHDKRS